MAAWTKVVLEGDITGTSPIAVQGSALSLSVSGLPDAGTPAITDKLLSWNGTEWETVNAEEFLGGAGVAVTINTNADNRIITGSDSSNTLNGEANLTYSTNLEIASGDIRMTTNNSFLHGKLSGQGAVRPIIGINSSDDVVVGNADSDSINLVGLVRADDGIARILTTNSGLTNSGDYSIGTEILKHGSTATSAGRVYYLNTNGSWSAADSGQTTSATALLGIATGTSSSDGMIIRGMVRPSSILGSPSPGEPLYLGATGSFNAAAPTTSGHVKRLVGHFVSSGVLYFNPDVYWETV